MNRPKRIYQLTCKALVLLLGLLGLQTVQSCAQATDLPEQSTESGRVSSRFASYCTVNEPAFEPVQTPKGGMAAFRVFSRLASLNIFDVPLSYSPPRGLQLEFRTNYNFLEGQNASEVDFTNLGPGWTLNWSAFLHLEKNGDVSINVPGGGSEYYPLKQSKNNRNFYGHNLLSQAQLEDSSGGKYKRNLPDGSVEIYSVHDEKGRIFLSELQDHSGNSIKVSYDQWFRIQSIIDPIGQVSKLKYLSEQPTSKGFFKVSEISDPFGRRAVFNYDKEQKRLLSGVDAIGLESKYEYGPEKGAVITALVTSYGETKFKHYKPVGSPRDSLGLKVTHPDGSSSVTEHWSGSRHATYQWNRRALELYPQDPEKHIYTHCKISRWLTEAGSGKELSIIASEKQPLETELVYSYKGQGVSGFQGTSNKPSSIHRRVQAISSNGKKQEFIQSYSYEYNAFGKSLQEIDPVGRVSNYVYAKNGIDLLERRDKNNRLLAAYEYDERHNIIRSTDASGMSYQYEYNKFGQISKEINPDASKISYEYDKSGYLLSVTAADLQKVSFEYDKYGRVKSRNSMGESLAFEYDHANRVTKVSYPDGSSEIIKYERLNPVFFQDRVGGVSRRTFDSFGNLSSLEDPLGRKTQYKWCICGALRELCDPASNLTQWHHDIQGRVVEQKYANGSECKYEYEEDGHRLIAKIDALGQKTCFSYYLDDRIAEIRYENALHPTSSVKYVYAEDAPMLVSASNSEGSIGISYFPASSGKPGAGRPRAISNSLMPDSVITLDYDLAGRVRSRAVNGGQNLTSWKFDSQGRVISEMNNLGQFSYQYASKPNGVSEVRIQYPGKLASSLQIKGFDKGGKLLSISNQVGPESKVVSGFNYQYDKAGLISSLKEVFDSNPNLIHQFQYDLSGQLKSAELIESASQKPYSSYGFDYDLAANLTSIKSDKQSTLFQVNNVNELAKLDLVNVGSQSKESIPELRYDANGNLTFDGKNRYEWDACNRLVRIVYPGSDNYTVLSYNPLGQLWKISEVENKKASSVKQLLWFEANLCEERDSDNIVTRRYYALGEIAGGKKLLFCRDHLGSVRQVLDINGEVLARIDYDPFGRPTLVQGSVKPEKQFSGFYTHERSGLNLSHFRAYHSKLARWLSRDPSGEFGLLGSPQWHISQSADELIACNLYAFAGNNAMNYVDPLGLQYNNYNAQGTAVRNNASESGTVAGTRGYNWSMSYTSQGSDSLGNQPGQVVTSNTYGNGVNGALADSGQRLGAGSVPPGYILVNGELKVITPEIQQMLNIQQRAISLYNQQLQSYFLAKQAWDAKPWWEKIGQAEPKPPVRPCWMK